MRAFVVAVYLAFSSGPLFAAAIRGVVINAESGAPMAKVSVYLAGTAHRTVSDQKGEFTFEQVPAGEYELVATAVGFGLIKQKLAVPELEPLELQIILAPGTEIRNEITVSASSHPSHPELSQAEIHELKSVLLDDAFRAVQQLPGVVAHDDFDSGFALQGSGFDRVGMLFDGIPVYSFLHTIEGQKDTGSASVLSAELLQGLDLVPAGTSAESGAGSAGFLRLISRAGNESRWRSLLSVSGSAVMGLSEGPLGNGSWIASARKSYIDWIVKRIEPDADLNFGFYDVFAKLVQRKGQKDSFGLSFFHGNTSEDNVLENLGFNTVDQGGFRSDLFHFSWDHVPSDRLNLSTHAYWQEAESLNRNRDGRVIWSNSQRILGARVFVDWKMLPQLLVSTGLTLEDWSGSNFEDYYDYRARNWTTLSHFQTRTSRQEVFVQTTYSPLKALALTAGCNWNRLAAVEGLPGSPFVSVELAPGRHRASLSYGETHQPPFLIQLFGQYGNRALEPEQARIFQAIWAYSLYPGVEVRVSGYKKTREGVPWRPEGQWRLSGDVITAPSPQPFQNALRDRSKGAEIQVRRKAVNGLAGWVGYSWGQSLWSERDPEWFPGNYDQRHALSLFAQYRWTSQFDLSGKWRHATGLPVPAYVSHWDRDYYLAPFRNQIRLPDYSRVDVRAAKSFNRDRYRLTLFLEVVNLLNHDNVRFAGIGRDDVNLKTGRVYDLDHTQFPILPTAGLVVEF
ncbi:MAG: carboxypeptidase regulatory-like domain-containing protein [Acidobacteriota bacterium]